MTVVDDARLLQLAVHRPKDAFPILERAASLSPLVLVLTFLPGIVALQSATLSEPDGQWRLKGLEVSTVPGIFDGVDPEDLKIAELFTRATTSDAEVREVVLATNPTTTGEATALHVAEELRVRAPEIKVTRLASGLPVGGELEYADELTLGRALEGRREIDV